MKVENAVDVCLTASRLVAEDRERTHGDKVQNMSCIAAMLNGYLDARRAWGLPDALDGHDAANMMECMKIARRLGGDFNPDDYVDGAGYSAVAFALAKAAR